jgi:hypothetical protein
MGRRRDTSHSQETRDKIKITQLINRLTQHAMGEVEMTATQVTAALGLIRKALPDLAAMEVKAQIEHHTVSGEVMDISEWEKTYGNNLEATERPTKVIN